MRDKRLEDISDTHFDGWREKVAPLLYDWLTHHHIEWPTQTCRCAVWAGVRAATPGGGAAWCGAAIQYITTCQAFMARPVSSTPPPPPPPRRRVAVEVMMCVPVHHVRLRLQMGPPLGGPWLQVQVPHLLLGAGKGVKGPVVEGVCRPTADACVEPLCAWPLDADGGTRACTRHKLGQGRHASRASPPRSKHHLHRC